MYILLMIYANLDDISYMSLMFFFLYIGISFPGFGMILGTAGRQSVAQVMTSSNWSLDLRMRVES